MSTADLVLVGPELVLIIAAVVVLLQDAWATGGALEPQTPRTAAVWGSLAAVGLALVWDVGGWRWGPAFGGMYVRDHFTMVADLAALAAAGLGILLSSAYLSRVRLPAGPPAATPIMR